MIALTITALFTAALQLSDLPEGLKLSFIFKRALEGLPLESEPTGV